LTDAAPLPDDIARLVAEGDPETIRAAMKALAKNPMTAPSRRIVARRILREMDEAGAAVSCDRWREIPTDGGVERGASG
jgi:hypothetical protein